MYLLLRALVLTKSSQLNSRLHLSCLLFAHVFFDLMNDNQIDQINTASVYQWYNLNNLWKDVERSKDVDGTIINLFSEPVATKEVIATVFDMSLENSQPFNNQNFRTIHSDTGYWESKENILKQMKDFLNENWG